MSKAKRLAASSRFLAAFFSIAFVCVVLIVTPTVVYADEGEPTTQIDLSAASGDSVTGGLAVDALNFPDPVFRGYVALVIDTTPDGILYDAELSSVTTLMLGLRIADVPDSVYWGPIHNLKGIEFFPNLTTLYCNDEELELLDVSQNVKLERLFVQENRLTSLDVSKNSALTTLYGNKNSLTSLDVSHNPALTSLSLDNNSLTSLDVSQNPALTLLSFDNNSLTSIDVSHNPALATLSFIHNEITTLDVTNNLALKSLSCSLNKLGSLDVSNNYLLTGLSCSSTLLTSLDVSNNPDLISLRCDINELTSLDVSNNPALWYLSCSQNPLASLDVSNNPELTSLITGSNQFTTLDISRNVKLRFFTCNDNQLTALDVTQNLELRDIEAQNNQITSLDLSKQSADLIQVWLSGNPLKTLELPKTIHYSIQLTSTVSASINTSTAPPVFDVKGFVGADNLEKVSFSEADLAAVGASYDSASGALTFAAPLTDAVTIPYSYDTGGRERIAYDNSTTALGPLVVSLVLIPATTGPEVGAPGSGDLNGDGEVTVTDAILVLRFIAGDNPLNPAQIAAVDLDGDGIVTIGDAILLLRKIAGL